LSRGSEALKNSQIEGVLAYTYGVVILAVLAVVSRMSLCGVFGPRPIEWIASLCIHNFYVFAMFHFHWPVYGFDGTYRQSVPGADVDAIIDQMEMANPDELAGPLRAGQQPSDSD
jgi:hypothetical protein